jgi:hypothetical protein
MNACKLSLLPLLVLFAGCSGPKLLGTSSSQIVTRTTRTDSRLEGSLIADGIPHLPDIPAGSAWTLGGMLDLPAQYDENALEDRHVELQLLPSGTLEARRFLGNRWSLGVGLQANERGISSTWLGVGKGFPIARAEGMIRLGAGLQRLDVQNQYKATTTRTDCGETNACSTIYTKVRAYGKQEEIWSPVGRLALSIQPLRSGPWIDLQASTALVFAEWPGVETSTVMNSRYGMETNCSLFGSCDDSTWTETETGSASGEHQSERIATWSTGVGWIFRHRHQQWSIGARWFPDNGTVQANAQWSVSFATPSR